MAPCHRLQCYLRQVGALSSRIDGDDQAVKDVRLGHQALSKPKCAISVSSTKVPAHDDRCSGRLDPGQPGPSGSGPGSQVCEAPGPQPRSTAVVVHGIVVIGLEPLVVAGEGGNGPGQAHERRAERSAGPRPRRVLNWACQPWRAAASSSVGGWVVVQEPFGHPYAAEVEGDERPTGPAQRPARSSRRRCRPPARGRQRYSAQRWPPGTTGPLPPARSAATEGRRQPPPRLGKRRPVGGVAERRRPHHPGGAHLVSVHQPPVLAEDGERALGRLGPNGPSTVDAFARGLSSA